ncbi:hypothetical protein VTN77DRAFT_7372 [Rasamsonia byssochlamydoides]|uniref:uncharacterized protein n=1 Tax=Rasamsonia byssochlamydoides TaxID=89139 RepID=UPI003742CBB5
MYQNRHKPRSLECCGCYQKFKSFSGMLVHLESGACESNIDADNMDELAFECYQSVNYATDLDDDYPYFCPGCEVEFSTLSGLFQHVEAVQSCSKHNVWPGCLARLQRFLLQRL